MATIAALTENFEGGSNGANISTGNSIFDSITGSGTATFINDAQEGSLSGRVATTAATRILRADITSTGTLWVGFYIKIITTPDATSAISSWFSNTTKVGDFRLGTDNTVSLRDNNTTVWTSTALATNTWHRIAIKSIPNSATGHRVRIYSGANLDTMTTSQDSGDLAATASGMTAVDNFRMGVIGSSTSTLQFDRLRGASEPFGIGGADPLVANAGADQNDVEPYSTITLTGSATGGTSPFSYSWVQTAGSPTVTLSGSGASRTFTAPALLNGTTLTFQVTVTDSVSVSDTDDVVVTVQLHNEFTRTSGGSWAPYNSRNREGGTWVG
jgi:hypothetical protein